MKRLVLGLIASAGLAAAAMAQDEPTLSADGYGPLKFGMPAESVLRLLQDEKPYSPAASDACKQISLKRFAPMGLSFVIEHQILVRMDVDFTTGKRETSAKTDTGIGLGSAEEDVLKAYPDAVIKKNPEDPSWHTIVSTTADKRRGLIFETNGRTVKSFRAGLIDAISSTEACQ